MPAPTRSFLIFALAFYLLAQAFQQYVLLAGPLASVAGLEQSIVAGQHTLNYVRYGLIYASMFLMVPVFVIVCLSFRKSHPVASTTALVFFVLFCTFEIGYRSVHLFQVAGAWGKEFVLADTIARATLLPRFQLFYQTVNALYVPLLLCLLAGSACLAWVAFQSGNRLLFLAMIISAIQQLSRLAGYTPLHFLDVFTGIWYFVLVLFSFGLMIAWVARLPQRPEAS
jgi:hypothetical protein